jgi:hypothetical protein
MCMQCLGYFSPFQTQFYGWFWFLPSELWVAEERCMRKMFLLIRVLELRKEGAQW